MALWPMAWATTRALPWAMLFPVVDHRATWRGSREPAYSCRSCHTPLLIPLSFSARVKMALNSTRCAPAVYVFSTIPCLFSKLQKSMLDTEVINIDVPDKSSAKTLSAEGLKQMEEAEIILCDPGCVTDFGLVYSFPKLKWMQSTWAGVNTIMRDIDKQAPPKYTLTRFAGCFGPHMAEYTLGHIISHQRQFTDMRKDQEQRVWTNNRTYRLLSELTLGILGAGDIGRVIAKAAKTFGMQVWGLTSQDTPPSYTSPYVDHYRGPSTMTQLLEACDYIVNVLPSTPQTRGLLSGQVLSVAKTKKPVLINIGRGDVIDEKSILHALSENWISEAVLDVFEEEPLSRDSALWTHPRVTISPHCSGISLDWQTCELFAANYKKYTQGEPLDYIVAWERGY